MDQARLAAFFGLRAQSIFSKYYTTMVLALLKFFEQTMKVPTPEDVRSCYPKRFIDVWGNCRTMCLYDCTEHRIEAAKDSIANAIAYSCYKNNHTAKWGVGSTPTG